MLDGAQRSICFLLLKATKSGSPAPLGMTTSGLGPPRRLASRAVYGRRVSSAQPSMYLAGLRPVQSSWRLPRPDGVSGEAGAAAPLHGLFPQPYFSPARLWDGSVKTASCTASKMRTSPILMVALWSLLTWLLASFTPL